MAISAGGGLPASALRGAAQVLAVSDGTTVAGNEASAAVSARLRSYSSPGIHCDTSSACSRRSAACSGSSRQSLASPLYASDSDGEGISNVPGVYPLPPTDHHLAHAFPTLQLSGGKMCGRGCA